MNAADDIIVSFKLDGPPSFKLDGPPEALAKVAHLVDPQLRARLGATFVAIDQSPPGSLTFGGVHYSINITGPTVTDIARIHYRGHGLCEAAQADPTLRLSAKPRDRDAALQAIALLEQTAAVLKHLVAAARVEP